PGRFAPARREWADLPRRAPYGVARGLAGAAAGRHPPPFRGAGPPTCPPGPGAGRRTAGPPPPHLTTPRATRPPPPPLARTRRRWTEWLWGKITKAPLGYGYQPWRALLFLAGVVVLSCVLAVVLGSHGALAQAKGTAAAGESCTVIQQISVGLDLNLPVGTSLARAGCGLPKNAASAAAAWLVAAGWVLRVLAWGFAALFIAGFTGAVRKT